MNFDVDSHLILKGKIGSHAHGTATADSDDDFRGIVIAPKSFYLGLDHFEQYEQNEPDIVYYDIQKYVQLALKANPSILELLFLEEYELRTPYADKLIAIRDTFLSRRCAQTYIGYAVSQLQKLRVKLNPASRTEKRMLLVQKYGYDSKFAMHLVRLLNTCKEILSTGTLTVKRPEASYLLEIRNGKYTLDELEAVATKLIEEVREAEAATTIRKEPDYHLVNRVLVEIIEEFYESKA